MPLIKIKDKLPQIGNDCFIAETATLIGDVTLGDECSVWFNAVIRGDVNFIRIGKRVNIQDGAIIHGTFEKASTTIGNNVSIAHRAVVHGCTIEDNVLVGIGAIILDNAYIGNNSIIAAGSLVLENSVIEPGSVYAGVPARRIKSSEARHAQHLIDRISVNYLKYASWYKNGS